MSAMGRGHRRSRTLPGPVSGTASSGMKSKCRTVIPRLGHRKEKYDKVSKLYKDNKIRTTKYTLWNFIPKNLFEQFHRAANLYFLFIVLLSWVLVVEPFRKEITMISLVLSIIATKDALEDCTKYKLDKKINNLVTQVYCRKEKQYKTKFWKDVHVGDVIQLSCNDEIPADMVLIYSSDGDGICHLETLSLDGETNLKQKQVVKGYAEQNWIHWSVVPGSVILFLCINGTFGAACVLCNPPASQYWVMQRNLSNPMFYLVCIITILVALLPRAANLYFLFIVLLNWVPAVEAFKKEITMIPLVVVLSIIATKDALEDCTKYKLDKKINHLVTQVYCRKEKQYKAKFWKDVHIGDIIRLSCNEEIPADMVLIYSSDGDGICHVETSSLDGETNLKERQVVKGYAEQATELNPETFSGKIECEPPSNDLNSFRGFLENSNRERVGLSKENLLMRGCAVRNTEAVVGIVVYAGHETKAMLNNSGSRYKRSKLEKRVNHDIIWSVLLLGVMCLIGAVGHGCWLSSHPVPPLYSTGKQLSPTWGGFLMFWTMIILLQVLIPISLYVSIEFVKLGQIYFIRNDIDMYDEATDTRIQCGSLNITENLGQIQYIFSDKTGTLTENKMVFRRCTIAGYEYGHEENAKRLEAYIDYDEDEDEAPLFPSHCTMTPLSRSRFFSRKSSAFLSSKSLSHMFHSTSTVGMRQLAFSSPIEKDVVPDMQLVSKFNLISLKHYTQLDLAKPMPELVYINEFFTALAICNTVVVAAPDQRRLKRRWSSIVNMPVLPMLDIRSMLQKLSSRRISPMPVETTNSGEGAQPDSLKKQPKPVLHVTFPTSLSIDTTTSSEGPSITVASQHEEAEPFSSLETTDNGLSSECLSALQKTQVGLSSEPLMPPELSYEAESPDEAALVHAARAYQCILKARNPEQVTVDLGPLGIQRFQLLRILPFDSTRKCMSVVVKHPILNQIVVYTKGADSVIMDLLTTKPADIKKIDLQRKKIKERTQMHLDEYATKGLRTLCIAMKVMSSEEYEEWLEGHYFAESSIENREQMLLESATRLEKNFTLLGATGIEDRLQDGVPESIEALRKAGISVWMLTGDKRETAVNIACSCKLLDSADKVFTLVADSRDACEEMMESILEDIRTNAPSKDGQTTASQTTIPQFSSALVTDGPTLVFALHPNLQSKFLQLTKSVRAVICCRATPLQKGQLVTLVRKELKVMTLAIGDGANDVSMIQVADVGIGIAGQEGMQAVLASDFAISQFKHLSKLLFVHGHWCYTRLANMILYFFYKNLAYVGLLFWFQFFCGFSGTPVSDYWSLFFFNLLYTSVPPVVYGVLDSDVSAQTLLQRPELYKAGQRNEPYVKSAFAGNLADALYQSLICFLIPYFTFLNFDIDVYSFGSAMNTSMFFIITLHLVIESKSLNWIHCSVIVGSGILFFFVNGVFGAACVLCNPPANPYWVLQRHLSNPVFYLLCIITTAVALLPRFMFRVIQTTVFPSPLMEAKQLEEKALKGTRQLLRSPNIVPM